jgi:hypothetical protein
MYLKPQDILVLLKLSVWDKPEWRQEDLAMELGMVQSMVHSSLKRAEKCGLYNQEKKRVNKSALIEVLVHSIRFLIPGEFGRKGIGMPTAWGHREAFKSLVYGLVDPPIWSAPKGRRTSVTGEYNVEGVEVQPIHEKAPEAASRDPRLYEVLAAVDALRMGRARDTEVAGEILRNRICGDRDSVKSKGRF